MCVLVCLGGGGGGGGRGLSFHLTSFMHSKLFGLFHPSIKGSQV